MIPLHASADSDAAQIELVAPGSADAPRSFAFADLAKARVEPGRWLLRFTAPASDAIEIPPCAGRAHVKIGSVTYAPPPGPFVLRATGPARAVEIEIDVSAYERRVACGYAPRAGAARETREGLSALSFASPTDGKAVVFVPRGHDATSPAKVLVGLHPWNGSIWTYASYAELLDAAQANDVVLLFPSGLGNSLYTRAAEEEVMRAIAALGTEITVDAQRVSIFGASMGGAGATTVGLHRPDRFASITSLFGDAKYDLDTYVRAILPTPAAAHLVDAIDVAENARHVPVWLIHGEDDRVSPIEESAVLARALEKLKYTVRFDRVPGAGHDGALVAKNAPEIVTRAATLAAPARPSRVTFKSVRDEDVEAYGVRLVRASPGDAMIDVELRGDSVVVNAKTNVREIVLRRGALGTKGDERLPANARWD